MNTNSQIFLYDQIQSKFIDKTNDISNISEASNKYIIEFNNGKKYTYGKNKVRFYQPTHLSEKAKTILEYFNAIVATGKIQSFDIPIEDIDQKQVESNNETLQKILAYALKTINTESDSLLNYYLNNRTPIGRGTPQHLIFPFGCNASQKKAVETSLSNNISIIEGPPGTGKTQTILNIIANLIMQNKTIAVVSNNNSAVKNIEEKLQNQNYTMVLAALGNHENVISFFNNQQEISLNSNWKLEAESRKTNLNRVKELSAIINELFQYENELAILRTKLSDAEVEFEHLKNESLLSLKQIRFLDNLFFRKWNARKALHFKMFIEERLFNDTLKSIIAKAQLLFQYGVWKQQDLLKSIDILPMYANHLFYRLFIVEVQKQISDREEWLSSHNKEAIVEEYIQLSKKLFNNKLYDKYYKIKYPTFDETNYKSEFNKFVKRYPIISSSTYSLPNSVPHNYLFDYLIIDEASQVDIITASLCFSCCRNAIIIGDSLQLTHIVDNEKKNISNALYENKSIPEAYNYVKHNILSSLKILYSTKLPTVMLREHYRCHPLIIGFCNRKFYNNELIIMTQDQESPFKIIESNIGGEHYGKEKGIFNNRQIEITANFLNTLALEQYSQIGIITPYKLHKEELQLKLSHKIEIDTIHKFQGREKNIIILNTVRNNINVFLDDPRLVNVAVSRAVKKFILVKPKSMSLPYGSNIGDLVRYIIYHSPKDAIIQSKIHSIFDILYKEYWKEKLLYQKKTIKREGSIAENRTYDTISEIKNIPDFRSIEIAREYLLADLVKHADELSDNEIYYIKHRARLDFLLYSSINNAAILAIEVDGVTNHRFDEEQIRRDKLKNHILECIGLPILRLSTDESNEKERIVTKLKEAMKVESNIYIKG